MAVEVSPSAIISSRARFRREHDATERLMEAIAPYNGVTAKGAVLRDPGRQAITTSEPLTLASPSGQHLTRSAVPVTAA